MGLGSNKQKLTILYTNDIHSHFEMMSSVAALISRKRRLPVMGQSYWISVIIWTGHRWKPKALWAKPMWMSLI